MATQTHVVFCTFPSADKAAECARHLVNDRLAACVNLVPQIRSIYRWNGELQEETEVLAILKTRADRLESLRTRLVELHPYDCPEFLALEVAEGHAPYLDWVSSQTR